MVNLFLSEPVWNDVRADESSELRKSLLAKLGLAIQSFLMSGARSEARLWLCESMAGLTSIASEDQRELFMSFLKSKPAKKNSLACQLLQMMFDKRPEKVGLVLSKKGYALEKFFKGNPTRIMRWFSSVGTEHGKGAKALTQFSFVNRDVCWEELEWKGKHGQSPAVVATKPHYFLDLDVRRTVENFIDNVPDFWSSDEFSDSLRDGEILSVDRDFFLGYFADLIYDEDSRDVWEAVSEFLVEESFSYLCRHLLIALDERDLRRFLGSVCKILRPRINDTEPQNASLLFEFILFKCGDSGSFDQILLLNAFLTKKRELIRLLREEGGDSAKAETKDFITRICAIPDSGDYLAPLIKDCFKLKSIEAINLLGIQSWVLCYRISEECRGSESWESLFAKNAIVFRKTSSFALLGNVLCEEYDSGSDHEPAKRVKHGKKHRKKRKRKYERDDRFDDGLVDFNGTDDDWSGPKVNGESWSLSIDGFCAPWTNVDLPEYLSHHSLSTWMRWILEKLVK